MRTKASGPFNPGNFATYLVDVATELHLSDYSLPVAPSVPSSPLPVPSPSGPPPQIYDGSDGPPHGYPNLGPGNRLFKQGGYSVKLQASAGQTASKLTWAVVRSAVVVPGDTEPCYFGIGFCPLSLQFSVFCTRLNVGTGVTTNYQPLVLQKNGGITARVVASCESL